MTRRRFQDRLNKLEATIAARPPHQSEQAWERDLLKLEILAGDATWRQLNSAVLLACMRVRCAHDSHRACWDCIPQDPEVRTVASQLQTRVEVLLHPSESVHTEASVSSPPHTPEGGFV